jgi:hypothetical protein
MDTLVPPWQEMTLLTEISRGLSSDLSVKLRQTTSILHFRFLPHYLHLIIHCRSNARCYLVWTTDSVVSKIINTFTKLLCIVHTVYLCFVRDVQTKSDDSVNSAWSPERWRRNFGFQYSRTLDCEQLGLRVFYKTSKNFEGILTW